MCHHAILVTSWGKNINAPHEKAKEIFNAPYKISDNDLFTPDLVSEINKGVMNCYGSFWICPDGSKEGWNDSNIFDERRKEFISYLKQNEYCRWAVIQYGDDYDNNLILESG